MARNVEIKARVTDRNVVAKRAAAIATEGPFAIAQDDTFFRCESGRLKLRILSEDRGEVIFYRRADQQGPKESFYLRAPTPQPAVMLDLLSQSYGQVGRVRKMRTLYLAGRTRIHLDSVEGLGDFLELEVVLVQDEALDAGVAEAHAIMSKLGIEESHLVEGAYVDMLGQTQGRG